MKYVHQFSSSLQLISTEQLCTRKMINLNFYMHMYEAPFLTYGACKNRVINESITCQRALKTVGLSAGTRPGAKAKQLFEYPATLSQSRGNRLPLLLRPCPAARVSDMGRCGRMSPKLPVSLFYEPTHYTTHSLHSTLSFHPPASNTFCLFFFFLSFFLEDSMEGRPFHSHSRCRGRS